MNILLMDLDGTIADTLPHLFRAFRHAVRPFVQRDPTDAEIVATFGPAEPQCLARLLSNPALARQDASRQVAEATRRFFSFYESHREEIRLFPGIREEIAQARSRGWRFAVFTGKSRHSAEFTLKHFQLDAWAECLISSDDVLHPKPAPDGVLLAARELQAPPAAVLVIGDSPADILAGKAAGARTAAALWGAFDRDATVRAAPDWKLESVSQLRQFRPG